MTHKIAFIGAGNMAYSLIAGLVKNGFNADNIIAADPYQASLDKTKTLGINTTQDNFVALQEADAVVLAVKPQVMQSVLTPLKDKLAATSPLLISIAAGIDIRSLAMWAGELAIVRCMPNTPALIQLGASGLYANEAVSTHQKALAEQILQAVGICHWLSQEQDLDAVTAVSGSGPAYFFLMIEAMRDAGIKQGLSPTAASELSIQTALGAASMAASGDVAVEELRRRVTSPGGTTERAIASFEANNFRQIVDQALQDCADHSVKLANELGA